MKELSKNENVVLGKNTYHVQTEYYKTSNKIVSNIIKDGKVIKRIERAPRSEQTVAEDVEKLHDEVISRLRRAVCKTGGIRLPHELKERLVEILLPYYGIVTRALLEDVLSVAEDVEGVINTLVSNIDDDEEKKEVSEELKREFDTFLVSDYKVLREKKEDILSILRDYYGILAASIFDDAYNDTVKSRKPLSFFVDELASQLPEGDAKELKFRLTDLLGIH